MVLLEDTSGKGHRSEIASDVDVLALVISVAESETASWNTFLHSVYNDGFGDSDMRSTNQGECYKNG